MAFQSCSSLQVLNVMGNPVVDEIISSGYGGSSGRILLSNLPIEICPGLYCRSLAEFKASCVYEYMLEQDENFCIEESVQFETHGKEYGAEDTQENLSDIKSVSRISTKLATKKGSKNDGVFAWGGNDYEEEVEEHITEEVVNTGTKVVETTQMRLRLEEIEDDQQVESAPLKDYKRNKSNVSDSGAPYSQKLSKAKTSLTLKIDEEGRNSPSQFEPLNRSPHRSTRLMTSPGKSAREIRLGLDEASIQKLQTEKEKEFVKSRRDIETIQRIERELEGPKTSNGPRNPQETEYSRRIEVSETRSQNAFPQQNTQRSIPASQQPFSPAPAKYSLKDNSAKTQPVFKSQVYQTTQQAPAPEVHSTTQVTKTITQLHGSNSQVFDQKPRPIYTTSDVDVQRTSLQYPSQTFQGSQTLSMEFSLRSPVYGSLVVRESADPAGIPAYFGPVAWLKFSRLLQIVNKHFPDYGLDQYHRVEIDDLLDILEKGIVSAKKKVEESHSKNTRHQEEIKTLMTKCEKLEKLVKVSVRERSASRNYPTHSSLRASEKLNYNQYNNRMMSNRLNENMLNSNYFTPFHLQRGASETNYMGDICAFNRSQDPRFRANDAHLQFGTNIDSSVSKVMKSSNLNGLNRTFSTNQMFPGERSKGDFDQRDPNFHLETHYHYEKNSQGKYQLRENKSTGKFPSYADNGEAFQKHLADRMNNETTGSPASEKPNGDLISQLLKDNRAMKEEYKNNTKEALSQSRVWRTNMAESKASSKVTPQIRKPVLAQKTVREETVKAVTSKSSHPGNIKVFTQELRAIIGKNTGNNRSGSFKTLTSQREK